MSSAVYFVTSKGVHSGVQTCFCIISWDVLITFDNWPYVNILTIWFDIIQVGSNSVSLSEVCFGQLSCPLTRELLWVRNVNAIQLCIISGTNSFTQKSEWDAKLIVKFVSFVFIQSKASIHNSKHPMLFILLVYITPNIQVSDSLVSSFTQWCMFSI